MDRRTCLKSLLSSSATLFMFFLTVKTNAVPRKAGGKILLQSSPVAGFQFYQGDRVWKSLQPGGYLSLIPEPDNRYDANAVKVMWRECQLGYIPRRENLAVSQILGRGGRLDARISEMKESENPWERVRVDIYLSA